MKFGFIGLGTMGTPMSKNLLKKNKGLELYVYDLNDSAIKDLVSHGAIACQSANEVVENADVIFTMVPTSKNVTDLYNGLEKSIRKGQIFADISTIDPSVSIKVAAMVNQKGAQMLDTPVVKSQAAAIDGTLGFYASGDKKSYETIKSYILCMGNNVIYLGDNGRGLVMKICHNMLVGQIQNGVNETITLAQSQGISVDQFTQSISYGGGSNFYLDAKAKSIDTQDFKPAFSIQNMNKDVFIAKDLAEEANLDLPGISLVTEVYKKAMEEGLGPLDFSATYKVVNKQ